MAIIAIGMAYLIGTLNPAFFFAKFKKVDLRSGGSGNLGASNATILMGWKVGILVAAHDIAKAALAVILAQLICPQVSHIGAMAGVACVLGHMFPFYIKFQGGKGFASYIGMTLAMDWKLGLIMMLVTLIVTLITDYIVVGTTCTVVAVPIVRGIARHSILLAGILCIATVVIIYKHRKNYVRMADGTEIGLRSTFRKKKNKNE